MWIPQFVPELHWSQSGPRLCYQHPRRHFWLKKYQFLEPWQLPHETRGLWKNKTDKRLIRLEWSERWNKSSTNSSFGPPGYGVRDEGTRKTRRVTTWFSEWPPSITHFSGENRLNARMKTAGEAQRNKHIHKHRRRPSQLGPKPLFF